MSLSIFGLLKALLAIAIVIFLILKIRKNIKQNKLDRGSDEIHRNSSMKKMTLIFSILAFLIASYTFLNSNGYLHPIKNYLVISSDNSNFSDSNNESVNSTTNPTKEQTVDEYEASIPIESVQSPLYARYGGNCFVICRTEDNAKLRTHVTDYKGYFIEDIKSALDGRETKYFSSEIRNNGSFVKFSFNGMSYDLTKRQCEKLIYDFNHPKPYLGH